MAIKITWGLSVKNTFLNVPIRDCSFVNLEFPFGSNQLSFCHVKWERNGLCFVHPLLVNKFLYSSLYE